MSDTPQLATTTAITTEYTTDSTTTTWFEYAITVYPHDTDYGGIVWHGAYLTWMEEARIECLRAKGIEFADLVNLGCDLPVVEISLRYHRPLRLGQQAILKTRMTEVQGVKIYWDYQIQSPSGDELYVTGKVTLVVIDREKGKIMRQLPPVVQDVLARLSNG